jgi:hypothetical protein
MTKGRKFLWTKTTVAGISSATSTEVMGSATAGPHRSRVAEGRCSGRRWLYGQSEGSSEYMYMSQRWPPTLCQLRSRPSRRGSQHEGRTAQSAR